MIEFKRTGDVMIFDCPAFRIEVAGSSEKITLSDSGANRITQIQDAFKVLDMMLEHKARQTPVAKVDRDVKIDFDIKRSASLYPGSKIATGDASMARDYVDSIYQHGALKTEGK